MQPGAESASAMESGKKLGMNVIGGGPCLLVIPKEGQKPALDTRAPGHDGASAEELVEDAALEVGAGFAGLEDVAEGGDAQARHRGLKAP